MCSPRLVDIVRCYFDRLNHPFRDLFLRHYMVNRIESDYNKVSHWNGSAIPQEEGAATFLICTKSAAKLAYCVLYHLLANLTVKESAKLLWT